MTAPLDAIRAKVEEVRKLHKPFNSIAELRLCSVCCAEDGSHDRWPCDALTGWEAALKLAEALEECDELFAIIRSDWSDPRAECRAGRDRVGRTMADIAEGLK